MKSTIDNVLETFIIRPKTIAGKLKILIVYTIVVLFVFTGYVYFQINEINKDYYKLEKYSFGFQNVFVLQNSLAEAQKNAIQKIYKRDESLSKFNLESMTSTIDTAIYALSLADTADFKLRDVRDVVLRYEAIVQNIGKKIADNERNGTASLAGDSLLISELNDNKTIQEYFGKLYGVYFPKVITVKDRTNEKLLSGTKRLPVVISVLSVLVAISSIFVGRLILKSLKKSIEKPKILLQELSKGILPEKIENTEDELSYIIDEANTLSNNIKEASNFAIEIGKANFTYDFKPSSDGDVLGNALVKMSDELKSFNEKEKQQNWAVAGQSKFSEILRKNNKNLEQTCDELLNELVKYIDANQGGIFFYNDNRECLEMISCYAYDRKKFLKKQIGVGEGLVGQCYLEGEMIYINDVPEDYINITSGLGYATPRAVLIVPITYNQKTEGVIELATFGDFDQHKIDFIVKLGEMLAASVTMIKHTQVTEELLEESQFKSQNLAQQEEEMRQNLEELNATQEEFIRREENYLAEIQNLKQKLGNSQG